MITNKKWEAVTKRFKLQMTTFLQEKKTPNLEMYFPHQIKKFLATTISKF